MNAQFASSTTTPRSAWNADPLRFIRYRLRHLTKTETQTFYREGVIITRYDDTTFGVTRKGYAMLFRKNNSRDTLEAIIERAARYAAGKTDAASFSEELDEFDA